MLQKKCELKHVLLLIYLNLRTDGKDICKKYPENILGDLSRYVTVFEDFV